MPAYRFTCRDCDKTLNRVGERNVDSAQGQDVMAALGTRLSGFLTHDDYVKHRQQVHRDHFPDRKDGGSDCDCWEGGWG